VSLLDLSSSELLDRLASPDPTPGGGSAAALAGAAAAALVAMVAAMPKTRTGTPDERAALDAALARSVEQGEILRRLVTEDALAYDAVIAARRRPKGTDAEKTVRAAAMDAGLARAAEVPLHTAEACLVILGQAAVVLTHGNPRAESDVRTAAALAWAGLTGGLLNVRANLESEAPSPLSRKADELQSAARQALVAVGL